jgi:hypothetical protein
MTANPNILQVDMSGMPARWISIQEAISYYARGAVLFELGNPIVTYRGGHNSVTNTQSEITANSIIAINGSVVSSDAYSIVPHLTNEKLFQRDHHLCAYCGQVFANHRHLSRDHIQPVSKGGQDTWMNVVTSCRVCNGRKADRTPEKAGMPLLYLPYTPDRFENFILEQGTRRVLADQMEFLLSRVGKKSRMHQFSNNLQ